MRRKVANKTVFVIVVLFLTAPTLLVDPAGAADGEGRASPRAGGHDGRIAVDLGAAIAINLTVKGGEGARLASGPDYIAGPVTTVETYPPQHHQPVVAMNSKCESILAWTSSDFDSNIYARRYDQNGSKLGPDIPVASKSYFEATPSVAVWPNDRFIIAWSDCRAGYTDSNIYAQMYDPAGNKIGGQLDIVEDQNDQRMPVVAVLPDSGFVVSWQDLRGDEIRFQRYDSFGGKAGDEISVYRFIGVQSYAMAANRIGDIAIAAVGKSFSNETLSLQAKVFVHDGNSSGNGIVIVPSGDAMIYPPSIAAGSGNDFLIAWYDGYENSTARRIRPDGILAGASATLKGVLPAVAALSNGGFIAATLEDWKNVSLQRYDVNGMEEGPAWSPGAGYQGPLCTGIAVGPDDRLAVFWKKGLDMVSDELDLCQYGRSHLLQGRLETADLSPPDVVGWTNLTFDAVFPNASANSISFTFSTDGGAVWHPVPANLSLAAAGRAPALRLRAELATSDPKTSPVLISLAVGFVADRAPSVSDLLTLTMWAGAQVTIIANGSDPDGDALTYLWTQTAGPDLGLNATANASILVAPDVAGNRTLSVVAGDGWLFSAPASMYVVVKARPPVALAVRALRDSPVYEVRLEASVPAGGPAVLGYDFDFGDNTTSGWLAAPNTTHAYARDGTFRAKVTVRYDDAQTQTSETVTVKARRRAEEPSLMPMLVITAIIIMVVAALVLALAVRRRKGRVTVIQYQPPAQPVQPPGQPPPSVPPQG
jgi:hypothetical protein